MDLYKFCSIKEKNHNGLFKLAIKNWEQKEFTLTCTYLYKTNIWWVFKVYGSHSTYLIDNQLIEIMGLQLYMDRIKSI